MIFNYEEKDENYQFRYWLTYSAGMFYTPGRVSGQQKILSMDDTLDINEWLGANIGPIGILWGFEQTRDQKPVGIGTGSWTKLNPQIHYSWRFKEEQHALLFKMTWGGK